MNSIRAEIAKAVLYLDLDGTVRHGYDELGRFVNGPDDVVVFPEAVTLMERWKAAGGRIVGVSNQGGIALGLVAPGAVAKAMLETQRQCNDMFDRIMYCQHHPDAADPEMARCWCRKPSAGAIAEAANGLSEAYPMEFYPPHLGLMVGDRSEDEACAASACLDFMWAADWRATA